jgi:hypothetical protein
LEGDLIVRPFVRENSIKVGVYLRRILKSMGSLVEEKHDH